MLVCTPGRLLQHMDETPGFDASQIQALVLDEADRILDMGFAATLNAILQNLPQERQTMLFSATQTKSVKDLARLSLKAPEYIAVHAEAAMPTPVKLQQVSHDNLYQLCRDPVFNCSDDTGLSCCQVEADTVLPDSACIAGVVDCVAVSLAACKLPVRATHHAGSSLHGPCIA